MKVYDAASIRNVAVVGHGGCGKTQLVAAMLFAAIGLSTVFERREFCRYLCPVGGFIGLYSQTAPIELRLKDKQVCVTCEGKPCYNGSQAGYGCPWDVFPGGLTKNTYCGLCMECIRTCPHDNIAVNLRPFSADLAKPSTRMDEAFKAKMGTVTGYQGGSEIDIAVERGEIVCRGMDIPPHFGREPFDSWHKKGFDRHLLQSGPKHDPRMGDVPTLFELMDQFKTPDVMRGAARIIMASGEFGRPMLAGPGNPPERIKMIREAYAKAMRDPGLVEEAKIVDREPG